jgi:hypothetical protein
VSQLIYLKRLIAERLMQLVNRSTPGLICPDCRRWFPQGYAHTCMPRPFPWEDAHERR